MTEQAPLRCYDTAGEPVRALYRSARSFHTVDRVKELRRRYRPGQFGTMGVWEALEALEGFRDVSDPDVDAANRQHALQTAESMRREGLPDWLVFTGLIHDVGKILFQHGRDEDGTSLATQWSLVGDTFVVGCALPPELVYPEFNQLSPESHDGLGIYSAGCGLDMCNVSFGHDEYLYQVLCASQHALPPVALRVVRYHSLYAWHHSGCYKELESPCDADTLKWVKILNRHDLYSKRDGVVESEEVRDYYESLAQRYLPGGFNF